MAMSAILGSPAAALSAAAAAPPPQPRRRVQQQQSGSLISQDLNATPRTQLPAEFYTPSPILEGHGESDLDTPSEPATPVSNRPSQDFRNLDGLQYVTSDNQSAAPNTLAGHAAVKTPPQSNSSVPFPPVKRTATAVTAASSVSHENEPAPTPTPLRSARGSTTSLKRVMTGFSTRLVGKRQNSASDKVAEKTPAPAQNGASLFGNVEFKKPQNDPDADSTATAPVKPTKRLSMLSGPATRDNSPPSPCSPLEACDFSEDPTGAPTIPNQDDFRKKKTRSSTGLSLRGRVINFAQNHQPLRKRSAENLKQPMVRVGNHRTRVFNQRDPVDPVVDDGVGIKARRLSMCLPDDFIINIGELQNEYEFVNKYLGRHKHFAKGATSVINKMYRKGFPKEIYAIKQFRPRDKNNETTDDYNAKVKSEFSIGKSLHHPNIVESIELCLDHGRWNYVMEYCDGGDMLTLATMGYLTTPERANDRACLAKQLIQGIAYLHRNGIAHRDIKLENLLMTSDSKLKITDFGVSDVFSGIHPGLREAGGQCGVGVDENEIRLCKPGICGSIPYMAPEVYARNAMYDPRPVDIWSAGVCIVAITFCGTIWISPDETRSPMFAEVMKAWRKFLAKNGHDYEMSERELNFPKWEGFEFAFHSPSLRRLVWRMLHPNPCSRISAREILETRWFKNTACCQPESYDECPSGIDTTKVSSLSEKRQVIHNHRPPVVQNTHSLGKMPGQTGY
ncbi:putative hal protein kinase protein [Zalerion maritima]|uniref:Hal protein kinase protein n=1 Tax=Zalerion maritima TaxID=339359 RepID=A0AAD5RUF7_9PEZI|nr:putative hal protein kinase protein [Zalerion maritima]